MSPRTARFNSSSRSASLRPARSQSRVSRLRRMRLPLCSPSHHTGHWHFVHAVPCAREDVWTCAAALHTLYRQADKGYEARRAPPPALSWLGHFQDARYVLEPANDRDVLSSSIPRVLRSLLSSLRPSYGFQPFPGKPELKVLTESRVSVEIRVTTRLIQRCVQARSIYKNVLIDATKISCFY